MKSIETSNDNKVRDRIGLDPDRHYVDEYVKQMCDHFRERGVDRQTIADAMLTHLFKMLEANPFRSPGDEGAVRADQEFLWRMKHRIVPMSEQWDKGWIRIRREKGLTPAFKRTVDPQEPPPATVRRKAPPADYDDARFRSDLRLLNMRLGHVYTEREVLTRYNRGIAKALRQKKDHSLKLASSMTAAKKRVIGWMERTGQIVRAQNGG